MNVSWKNIDTTRYMRATLLAARSHTHAPARQQYHDTATIGNTLKRLRSDNYNLAETALRRFVRNGNIPSVMCGNKALLYYPNVIKFLTGGIG